MKTLRYVPRDLWHDVKRLLHLSDGLNALNSGSTLWNFIFKDTSWLELAKTYDRALPLLIDHELSAFRPGKRKSHYWALIVTDYSGDLQYEREQFIRSLQDGWKEITEYELGHESGVTLNIRDIIARAEATYLPLERIFSTRKRKPYCEYSYYGDYGIKILTSNSIIGLNGPAKRLSAVRHGCALRLEYNGQMRENLLGDFHQKGNIHANQYDEKGLISSFTEKSGQQSQKNPHPFLNVVEK